MQSLLYEHMIDINRKTYRSFTTMVFTSGIISHMQQKNAFDGTCVTTLYTLLTSFYEKTKIIIINNKNNNTFLWKFL